MRNDENSPTENKNTASNRTLEQRRAEHALQVVPAPSCDLRFRKAYRSYVERIGPSILMNGLGQALATEWASAGPNPQDSDKKAHFQLYMNLQGWLCRPGGVFNTTETSTANLLHMLTKCSQLQYRRAQAEALAWLMWHKKFCCAYLPKNEDNALREA